MPQKWPVLTTKADCIKVYQIWVHRLSPLCKVVPRHTMYRIGIMKFLVVMHKDTVASLSNAFLNMQQQQALMSQRQKGISAALSNLTSLLLGPKL